MKKSRAAVSPARQIASFIARFDPAIAKLIRSARSRLRKRFPTAVELVYDNYNALAIGWGATERASDVIVSIAAFPRGVSLYFIHGKKLTDPGRLLQGSGSQGRFIRLDTIATLDLPDVKVLLTEAASQSNASLRRTGKPHTVIKSISARQRPRRPGK